MPLLQFISQTKRNRSIHCLSRIAQTERRRESRDRRHDRNHEKVAQLLANEWIEEREGDLARDLRIGINAHVKIDTLAIFTIVQSIVKNWCRLARARPSFTTYEFVEAIPCGPLRASQQCWSCSLRKSSEVFYKLSLSPRWSCVRTRKFMFPDSTIMGHRWNKDTYFKLCTNVSMLT